MRLLAVYVLGVAACGDSAAPSDASADSGGLDGSSSDGAADGSPPADSPVAPIDTAAVDAVDAPPPDAACPPEVCDGLDDGDCDGLVDNGAICASVADRCYQGACVFPCAEGEFPCPPGYVCMTIPEGNFCIPDP